MGLNYFCAATGYKNVLRLRVTSLFLWLHQMLRMWPWKWGRQRGSEEKPQSLAGYSVALRGHRGCLQTGQDRSEQRIALVDEHGVDGKQNPSFLVGVEAPALEALSWHASLGVCLVIFTIRSGTCNCWGLFHCKAGQPSVPLHQASVTWW